MVHFECGYSRNFAVTFSNKQEQQKLLDEVRSRPRVAEADQERGPTRSLARAPRGGRGAARAKAAGTARREQIARRF